MTRQQLSEAPAHPKISGGRKCAGLGQRKDKYPPLLCRGGGARAQHGTREGVRQVTEGPCEAAGVGSCRGISEAFNLFGPGTGPTGDT